MIFNVKTQLSHSLFLLSVLVIIVFVPYFLDRYILAFLSCQIYN